jgi:hypothetical protein
VCVSENVCVPGYVCVSTSICVSVCVCVCESAPRRCTLCAVLLPLRGRPAGLADVGGRGPGAGLEAALVEHGRQVGGVDLPQLFVVPQGGAQVPVLTWTTHGIMRSGGPLLMADANVKVAEPLTVLHLLPRSWMQFAE